MSKKFTSEDVRKNKEEYRAWAKAKDREQYMEHLQWLRENAHRLKRGKI